jgi:hypothetical protein
VRYSKLVVFCVLTLCAGRLPAQESPEVEIPLESVWALDMPGTRDVFGIDLMNFAERNSPGWGFEEFRSERESSIGSIRTSLASWPAGKEALPGFVVGRKTDYGALRSVGMALSRGLKASYPRAMLAREITERLFGTYSFPSGSESTLVFFTHPSSYYVRLDRVTRRGNTFTVHYKAEPHYTAESTVHFALIPMGQLPAGEYQVRYEQVAMERKYLDRGFIPFSPQQQARLICRNFNFVVWDRPADEAIAPKEGAFVIPLDKIWAEGMQATKDVRELDPNPGDVRSPTRMIRNWLKLQRGPLRDPPLGGDPAGEGFVVLGDDQRTLAMVRDKIGKPRRDTDGLLAGSDVSIVVYGYPPKGRMQIASVNRDDTIISISYRITPVTVPEQSGQYAIIPVGRLPAGEYSVRMLQVADQDAVDGDPGIAARGISRNFSFRMSGGW